MLDDEPRTSTLRSIVRQIERDQTPSDGAPAPPPRRRARAAPPRGRGDGDVRPSAGPRRPQRRRRAGGEPARLLTAPHVDDLLRARGRSASPAAHRIRRGPTLRRAGTGACPYGRCMSAEPVPLAVARPTPTIAHALAQAPGH